MGPSYLFDLSGFPVPSLDERTKFSLKTAPSEVSGTGFCCRYHSEGHGF